MGDSEKITTNVRFAPNISGDTYEVTVSDNHNNEYRVEKEFGDFVSLVKSINKDIPKAKLELPPRGTKAFFAKFHKKFQQTRTKRLDETLRYICGHELISTHYEVKKFLSLDRLNKSDEFDPSADQTEAGSEQNTTITSQTCMGPSSGPFSAWPKNQDSAMSPSDFTYIMKIGKGSFGHVFLAKRNDPTDQKYYAIKILSKQLIMG
jgi:hypothetical protein